MNLLKSTIAAAVCSGCILLSACNGPVETETPETNGSTAEGAEVEVNVEYLDWSETEKLAKAGGKVTVIDLWSVY